ncbi:MAG: multiple sugar transport system substrate-binding protein [Methylobacteriaceae bacterium]|nr:multiple sugar transport system substrate-binding protein [Methylobacteriaceae bacterium]
MNDFSRRTLVKGAGVLGLAAGGGLLEFAKAFAQTTQWKPEPGASLNLLRWKRFVQSEDDSFMKMVDAFSKAMNVKVNVSNESFDDLQPKASVAANTGQGPDLLWGLYSTAQLFPEKCLDVTDVADYLGKKYGGWIPAPAAYGQYQGKWIAIPVAVNGGYINYRINAIDKAGFKEVPKDFPGFLELCRGLKKNNTPAGFALGHASGDGNGWVHWVLWGHGAFLVDKNDKVIINSPETAKALEYTKQLYETFIPGTASWNDSSNNKAFLAGELYLTGNGISIYVAAKVAGAGGDAKQKEIAEDMDHAFWPVGPIGKPTELQLAFPIFAFNFTKVPNACKAFMAFMMEAENYNPWLQGAQGYLTHTLTAYDNNPVWTADPKNKVFGEASKRTLTAGGLGSIGEKAAAALADFIMVDMVARYCTGAEDVKGTIRTAERQAQRIFRA